MPYSIPNLDLYIIKNEKAGEILTLSDNSIWHIVNLTDRVKTMIWILNDKIKIIKKVTIYQLVNLKNKDTVSAEYIESNKEIG